MLGVMIQGDEQEDAVQREVHEVHEEEGKRSENGMYERMTGAHPAPGRRQSA